MASITTVKNKVGEGSHKIEAKTKSKARAAVDFAHQAERLGHVQPSQEDDETGRTHAVEAKFITGQDPVIQTANGGRLPAVPIEEATKLNELRDIVHDRDPSQNHPIKAGRRDGKDGTIHGVRPDGPKQSDEPEAPLRDALPPARTNPLFPPMPLYGPPTLLRDLQCWSFRITSSVLSLCFLGVIVLGAIFTGIPHAFRYLWMRLTFRDPHKNRPFYNEEQRRRRARKVTEMSWKRQRSRERAKKESPKVDEDNEGEEGKDADEYIPLEGGPDPIKCDIRYYARRVGLDCEVYDVQTEDGFIIELWHLYNPREYDRTDPNKRAPHGPEVFTDGYVENGSTNGTSGSQFRHGDKRYPVLMIHGLLQSAGAYCTNDDDSLAFFLAKSGYDVWLGNNRCGFNPRHNLLKYGDPRMWTWNIRQMGVMDLPALISRVLSETGFEKLALIAHSQGTTQTLVALAKEQRPEIGEKISVFCALAPAAYAGRLIGKVQFKFMRIISPAMFRAMFGIHAFIPFMMTMHSLLPGPIYGSLGYLVFSFLFNWTDERWEKDLRSRMFQFAPVYVSAESMRWWLGRECFARQKCILSTREENKIEDKEDEQEDQELAQRSDSSDSDSDSSDEDENPSSSEASNSTEATTPDSDAALYKTSNDANITPANKPLKPRKQLRRRNTDRARYSWYSSQAPPFALWVCGADDLVNGRRLLRRFERNREPYVDVVHAKIIEGYEHLDVIWAMDAIEKVGKEVRQVIWRTAGEEDRKACRVPKGCGEIRDFYVRKELRNNAAPNLDATAGEWNERAREQVGGGGGEGDQNLDRIIREGEE